MLLFYNERYEFVEEYDEDAGRNDPADEQEKRTHEADMGVPVVCQLLFYEAFVEVMSDEEGHQEASQGHEEFRDGYVEEIEDAKPEDFYLLPWSEGERAETAQQEADGGDDGCGCVPAFTEVFGDEGCAYFVHADAACEGCQQEEYVEEEGKDVSDEGYFAEHHGKDVGQCDEYESGACVGCDADAEDCGEDNESAEDGYCGVDDADVGCGLDEACFLAEI